MLDEVEPVGDFFRQSFKLIDTITAMLRPLGVPPFLPFLTALNLDSAKCPPKSLSLRLHAHP